MYVFVYTPTAWPTLVGTKCLHKLRNKCPEEPKSWKMCSAWRANREKWKQPDGEGAGGAGALGPQTQLAVDQSIIW